MRGMWQTSGAFMVEELSMHPCTHALMHTQPGIRSQTPFLAYSLYFYRLLSAISRVETMLKHQLTPLVLACAAYVAYLEGFRDDPPEFRRVRVSLHGVGFSGASLELSVVWHNRCSGTCISRDWSIGRVLVLQWRHAWEKGVMCHGGSRKRELCTRFEDITRIVANVS